MREPPAGVIPTGDDEPLLSALSEDGRIGHCALAARTGWPEARVARRVEALLASGAIYLDVDVAAEPLGFATSARLYLAVAPSRLDAVGRELADHQETSFVAAVSGPANLAANVQCTGLDHLYRYVSTVLGAIPAIHSVETSPVLEHVKQAGSLMHGPVLASSRA